MKKLLTILAAGTATMFAFGINPPTISVADFEGENFDAAVGSPFDARKNDSYSENGDRFWYTADTDASNVISNYPSPGAAVPIASRPDVVAADANKNFIQIETTGRLWRSVVDNGGSADFTTNVTDYGHSIAETPIYLDTLVKFTAADAAFGDDGLTDGDKIAISYVECDAENDTIFDGVGYTNFVVRAGLIVGEQLTTTNYFVTVPQGFDKDAWHRLTVRTIPDVGTTQSPGGVGFVVYLDETNLTYSTGVNAGFGTLNATAEGFYNSEVHALFPSAIPANGTGGKTISAASFQGNGSLDDVVFTTAKPTFIANSETPMVKVTWDTNVVSEITIAGVAVTGENFDAGEKTVELEGTTLVVVATPIGGYELVYSPTYDKDEHEFTGLESGATCSITGFIPKFDVDGTHYEDLSDALEAAAAGTSEAPATLKLLADCNQALNFTEGYIILDLAGCDIQGNGSDFSIGNAGATLIITNSGTEASILVPADNGLGVEGTGPLLAAGGFTMIQAGTFEGIISTVADGDTIFAQDLVGITGGKFLFPGYDAEDPTSFYLYACVAQGLALSQVGDYVQVGESGGGGGEEDWPETPSSVSGQTAQAAFGITGDLANADAATLATWAKANNVNYADRTTAILTDAFLLNCANTQQAINTAAADFKITAITVAGDTVTITPADGADYGNGKVVIKGTATLSPISWHEKTTGDHFFRATLVVKPVATP